MKGEIDLEDEHSQESPQKDEVHSVELKEDAYMPERSSSRKEITLKFDAGTTTEDLIQLNETSVNTEAIKEDEQEHCKLKGRPSEVNMIIPS
jgi:hypothetical protein